MRIWSVHPKYLDKIGLVALWRESLLAKHVLEGKTKGYVKHPQLLRFKNAAAPLDAINLYLQTVYHEALHRGYRFDAGKFITPTEPVSILLNQGQLQYEWQHLLKKLQVRNAALYQQFSSLTNVATNPLFELVPGPVETWEIQPTG